MKNMIRTDLLIAGSAIALCDRIFSRTLEVILLIVIAGLLAVSGVELSIGEPGTAFWYAGIFLILGSLLFLIAALAIGTDILSRCERLRDSLRSAMERASE